MPLPIKLPHSRHRSDEARRSLGARPARAETRGHARMPPARFCTVVEKLLLFSPGIGRMFYRPLKFPYGAELWTTDLAACFGWCSNEHANPTGNEPEPIP